MTDDHGQTEQMPGNEGPEVGRYRAQHLALAEREIATEDGKQRVVFDEGESPLVWLARRRGRDGRALVEPHQLQASERLRRDFTYASLMPTTTANWSNPTAATRRKGGYREGTPTDTMVAARQQVHLALDAAGPEFAGLLVDVCCFLKGLEDIERERAWPARSAKIVLRLGLERLARHYGYTQQTRGSARTSIRIWVEDECASVESV